MDKVCKSCFSQADKLCGWVRVVIQSGLGSLDSIMALKEFFQFKYVRDNHSPCQYKDQVFVFVMYVDRVGSGVDHVKCMQCGGDMDKYWDMFDRMYPLWDLNYFGVSCLGQHILQGAHNSMLQYASRGCPRPNYFLGNSKWWYVGECYSLSIFKGFMAGSARAN